MTTSNQALVFVCRRFGIVGGPAHCCGRCCCACSWRFCCVQVSHQNTDAPGNPGHYVSVYASGKRWNTGGKGDFDRCLMSMACVLSLRKTRVGRVAASASLASVIRFCAWYMSCLWAIMAGCIWYASALIFRLQTNRFKLVQLSLLPTSLHFSTRCLYTCTHLITCKNTRLMLQSDAGIYAMHGSNRFPVSVATQLSKKCQQQILVNIVYTSAPSEPWQSVRQTLNSRSLIQWTVRRIAELPIVGNEMFQHPHNRMCVVIIQLYPGQTA